MKPIDNFYLQFDEAVNATLQSMKNIILSYNEEITATWKYGMPFFCYREKMLCYLWYHKKYKQPYLGIVEGNRLDEPYLIQENRSRMKIMLLDPTKNLPIKQIKTVLDKAIKLSK